MDDLESVFGGDSSITTQRSLLDPTLSRVTKTTTDEEGNQESQSTVVGIDKVLANASKSGIDDEYLSAVNNARLNALFPNSYATSGDWDISQVANGDLHTEYSPVFAVSGGTDWLGKSMFDKPEDDENIFLRDYSMHDIEDQAWMFTDKRAERQVWALKTAAGVGKGAINAGATFVEGTLGLLYGIGQCFYNAAADPDLPWYQGLFDNAVANTMEDIRTDMQDWMPNYTTRDERENPLALRNLLSANTVAEQIQNLGFMVGAYYSGAVWTKALSGFAAGVSKLAPNAVHTAFDSLGKNLSQFAVGRGVNASVTFAGRSLIPSTLMSYGEAATEATAATREYMETAIDRFNASIEQQRKLSSSNAHAQIDEQMTKELQDEIVRLGLNKEVSEMTNQEKQAYLDVIERYKALTQQRYDESDSEIAAEYAKKEKQAREKIAQESAVVGATTFGLNMVLLTGTNLLAFPALLGVSMFKLRGNDLTRNINLLKLQGKLKGTNGNLKQTLASRTLPQAIKGFVRRGISEGFEEGAQGVASSYAIENQIRKQQSAYDLYGDAYLTSGFEFYDDHAYMAYDIMDAIIDYVSTDQGKKEMLMGAISGTIGMPYSFRTVVNADGTTSKKFALFGEARDLINEARAHSSRMSDLAESLNFIATQGDENLRVTKQGLQGGVDNLTHLLITMSQTEFWDKAMQNAAMSGNLDDSMTAEEQKMLCLVAGLSMTGQYKSFVSAVGKSIDEMSDEEFDAFVAKYSGEQSGLNTEMKRRQVKKNLKAKLQELRGMAMMYQDAFKDTSERLYDAGFSAQQISHIAYLQTNARLQQIRTLAQVSSILFDHQFDAVEGKELDDNQKKALALRERLSKFFSEKDLELISKLPDMEVHERVKALTSLMHRTMDNSEFEDATSANPFSRMFISDAIRAIRPIYKSIEDEVKGKTVSDSETIASVIGQINQIRRDLYTGKEADDLTSRLNEAQSRVSKAEEEYNAQKAIPAKTKGRKGREIGRHYKMLAEKKKALDEAKKELKGIQKEYDERLALEEDPSLNENLPAGLISVYKAYKEYQESGTRQSLADLYKAINDLYDSSLSDPDLHSKLGDITYRRLSDTGNYMTDATLSEYKLSFGDDNIDLSELKKVAEILRSCNALMATHARLESFLQSASFEQKYNLYYKKCMSEIRNRLKVKEFKEVYGELASCLSVKEMQDKYKEFVGEGAEKASLAKEAIDLLAQLNSRRDSFWEKILGTKINPNLKQASHCASIISEKLFALDILLTRIMSANANPNYAKFHGKIDIEEVVSALYNFALSDECSDVFSLLRADLGSRVSKNGELVNEFYSQISIEVGKDLKALNVTNAKKNDMNDNEAEVREGEEEVEVGGLRGNFRQLSRQGKNKLIVKLLMKKPAQAFKYLRQMLKDNQWRQTLDYLAGQGCFGQKYANVRDKFVEFLTSLFYDSKSKMETLVSTVKKHVPSPELDIVLDKITLAYYSALLKGQESRAYQTIEDLVEKLKTGEISVETLRDLPKDLSERLFERMFPKDRRDAVKSKVQPIIDYLNEWVKRIENVHAKRISDNMPVPAEEEADVKSVRELVDEAIKSLQENLTKDNILGILKTLSTLRSRIQNAKNLRIDDGYPALFGTKDSLSEQFNALIDELIAAVPNAKELLQKIYGLKNLFYNYYKTVVDELNNIISRKSPSGQEEYNFDRPHIEDAYFKVDEKDGSTVLLTQEQLFSEIDNILRTHKTPREVLPLLLLYERAGLSKYIEKYTMDLLAEDLLESESTVGLNIIDAASTLVAAYVSERDQIANIDDIIDTYTIDSIKEIPDAINGNEFLETLWNFAKFKAETHERNENENC